jgi:hypothetical protein
MYDHYIYPEGLGCTTKQAADYARTLADILNRIDEGQADHARYDLIRVIRELNSDAGMLEPSDWQGREVVA